jgi:hypothetical protein
MAVVVTSALLVLGACRSGDNNLLTKDEFVKQGNAVCVTLGQEIDAASKTAFPQGTEPDTATVKKFVKETFVPTVKKTIDGLDALKPPKELQKQVDALISHSRDVLAKVEKQADTDPTAIFSYENDPFADVNKEAGNIGLTGCANSNNSSS